MRTRIIISRIFITAAVSLVLSGAGIGPAAAGVVLNEIMPNPHTDYWTTTGAGSDADGENEYIELYNAGPGSVDAGGWRLKRNGSLFATINATAATGDVPAGGHILIVSDDSFAEEGGPNITGYRSGYAGSFSLNNSGGYTISLHDSSDTEQDSVSLPSRTYGDDRPYYRSPDGGSWVYSGSSSERSPTGYLSGFATPTPVPTPFPSGAVLNEIMPNPASDYWTTDGSGSVSDTYNEYIEIYNAGEAAIDISGWTIKKDGSGTLTIIETDETQNVPPGGHILLVRDDTYAEQGGPNISGARSAHSGSWNNLNNDETHTISLHDAGGAVRDSVVLPVPGVGSFENDHPYYRDPDGGDWRYAANASVKSPTGYPIPTPTPSATPTPTASPTPTGQPSPTVPPTASPTPTAALTPTVMPFSQVVINQVGPFSRPGEYVELYNRGSSPVSLSGWKLDVYSGDYTFTAGDVILPQGFLLLSDTSPLEGVLPDITAGITITDNGGNSFVRLLDPSSTVKDMVGWAAASFYEESPLGMLAGGKAWKRTIDGVDTNNNSADFTAVSPDPRNGTGYDPSAGELRKERNTDLRLLAYNIEKNIFDPGKQPAFSRILGAIRPDVIVFEEMVPEKSSGEISDYLNGVLDYGSWDVYLGMQDGYNRIVLASRYPLSLKRNDTYPRSSTRGVTIALVDLPDEIYSRDLYIMGVHLKAMVDAASVAKRQKSCDALAAWMGDARNAPAAVNDYISLESGTPMVVMGDFNFVYGAGPDITLRTGDIQDNATYGPDVKGDWDSSDITDAAPANPYNGDTDTYPSYLRYPTGRLDRFYYTDHAAAVANGFILNTLTMDADQLTRAGLEEKDTSANETADHLPVVIDLRISPASAASSAPAVSDYDGDGISDIAIFRSSSGLWAVRSITRTYFGTVGDEPVSGDYDGDGAAGIAIFRPSSGLWALKGITRIYFGAASDSVVPGDYNGAGRCSPAIFRPSSGLWAIHGVTRLYFGTSGDTAVPGDYDGDGRSDIGIFRAGTGLWAVKGITRIYFGASSDSAVPGDYNGDGSCDPGIFRPATSLWAIRDGDRTYFGNAADEPVPADYDGSGADDIAVFRPSSGLWAINGVTRVYFGASAGP